MTRKKHEYFQIKVTRECIDNSERNSLHWCIYALAILYSIPGAVHVSVDKNEARFSYKGYRYVFPTPEKTAKIAKAYDDALLTKAEIQPWRDVLRNPISVEPIQHKRPKKAAAANNNHRKAKKERCSSTRSTRWSGRRI